MSGKMDIQRNKTWTEVGRRFWNLILRLKLLLN